MVERRLELELAVQDIFEIIDKGENFLLSGGAGSGKTYSLVQVIRQAIIENPATQIACMTYTFAAVREIEDRINHENLVVSTFHEFLWANIKHFKKELKAVLIKLINDEDEPKIKLRIEHTSPIPPNYFDSLEKGIQYKEYLRIREGVISHDELLIVANEMFKTYPLLCDILKDKFQFIFIDEYQDTDRKVIEIFLEHFKQTKKTNIIGFFGDAMQSIYDNGIGDLNDYIGLGKGQVREIKKTQNRRNPQQIIDLANVLRTDGIEQVPSEDDNAPNMKNGKIKKGNAKFIYSTDNDIEKIKNYLEWDFSAPEKTKELNLTHNLIAGKAGFESFMNIYDKDKILAYRNRIKKYIKDNDIKEDFTNKTFREVTEFLSHGKSGRELNKVLPTAQMREFITENPNLYEVALNHNYGLFSKIYVDKEQLIDDKKQSKSDISKRGSKRDYLIRHLFKIEHNISLYTSKRYNEFLRITDFRSKIQNIEKKKLLKKNIENLVNVGEKTIGEIIQDANEKGICLIDDYLERFKVDKAYIYDQVMKLKYTEFQNLYKYLEGHTPFSTKHKTKGTEFDNVFIILDNGRWNNYNFKNLFLGEGSESVLNRSQKIFYVCCTRAKENLAVYFHNPAPEIIAQAEKWFGVDNVISI